MLSSIQDKGDQRCQPIFPFPKEIKLTDTVSKPDSNPIFRLSNYEQKLKNVKCHSVYSRYTTLAINEAIHSGKILKPKFMIAPLNTNISFMKTASPFSISSDELTIIKNTQLPFYFSWMDNDHITKPFNQGLCGSCWAVASATCLSDVFVVSKKTDVNPKLSPTYMLSCLPQGQCNGGDPALAANDLVYKGISTSSCLDYSWCNETACSGNPLKHFDAENINQYIPACQCSSKPEPIYYAESSTAICIPPHVHDFSENEFTEVKYYLNNLYDETGNMNLSKESDETIQHLIKYHIYTYGPVMGGFHVFKNFFKGEYRETNDIYIETCAYAGIPGIDLDDPEKDWAGSHAVVIVGWGVDKVHDEDVNYWVVRNSWGTSWGKGGMYKMAMYGNDPKKKYQNKISQFEYPSIINTDNGIGITGGIILLKAGSIKQPEIDPYAISKPVPTPKEPVPTPKEPVKESDIPVSPFKEIMNSIKKQNSMIIRIILICICVVLFISFFQSGNEKLSLFTNISIKLLLIAIILIIIINQFL